MQKITPFLWFVRDADKAAKFYLSVFGKDSKITEKVKIENTPSGPDTYVMTVRLKDFSLTLFNGGRARGFESFCPSISFVLNCKNQKEVDYYWGALGKGGKPNVCGWLTDKYGVTWQIVPTGVARYLGGPDPEGRKRAVKAMLGMTKLDIVGLREAYMKKS
jgi:predicted 3-demethylubiquinone-9 3-methyltransferase (glyoxalase superfamily)